MVCAQERKATLRRCSHGWLWAGSRTRSLQSGNLRRSPPRKGTPCWTCLRSWFFRGGLKIDQLLKVQIYLCSYCKLQNFIHFVTGRLPLSDLSLTILATLHSNTNRRANAITRTEEGTWLLIDHVSHTLPASSVVRVHHQDLSSRKSNPINKNHSELCAVCV